MENNKGRVSGSTQTPCVNFAFRFREKEGRI